MANINGYLSEILGAVYGEEVRTSIYNSIKAVNDEAEGVISSATATINSYINNIELYKYVNELPVTGNEQTLYVVQDNIEYVNQWSDDYDIQIYGGSPLTELPAYLALEPQSEQAEAPAYLSSANFIPSFAGNDNVSHNFATIVHISGYSEGAATVANPEYAMLVVDINASEQLSSASGNMLVDICSILRSKYDDTMTNTYVDTPVYADMTNGALKIPWGYYDLNSRTNYIARNGVINDPDIPASLLTSLANRNLRYLQVNVKEYIYDSVSETWKYNNIYAANDILINTVVTNQRSLTLATKTGDGLVSGLILSDTNKSNNNWMIGILRSTTPADSYKGRLVGSTVSDFDYTLISGIKYSTVYTNNNQTILDFELNNHDAYNSYSTPSLQHPLQVIDDTTYQGTMYVWNNQLQHYIALKAEAEVTTEDFLYQFIETPSEKHMYPSDVNKWKTLAQNWAYLSTKGVVSTYHHYGRSVMYYLKIASYSSSSNTASFTYFAISGGDYDTLETIIINLNCTTGEWSGGNTYSYKLLSTTSGRLQVGTGLTSTIGSGNNTLTLALDNDYIPTGYVDHLTPSDYNTPIMIDDLTLDDSESYLINVAPDASSRAEWLSCQVACTSATSSGFIFTYTTQPTNSLTFSVTVQKINGSTVITNS